MAGGNSTAFNIQIRQDDHNNLSGFQICLPKFVERCNVYDHCQICINGLEKGMNEQLLL